MQFLPLPDFLQTEEQNNSDSVRANGNKIQMCEKSAQKVYRGRGKSGKRCQIYGRCLPHNRQSEEQLDSYEYVCVCARGSLNRVARFFAPVNPA